MPFLFVPVAEASLLQNKVLAIAPKVSSLLSLFSSGYIIMDVAMMYRQRQSQVKTYHRILLGMSICDALASFAWFFTTWPIPADVFPAYGASGNQATCTAQGFFAQFSISSVWYNGSLALYYCLVVRFGWSDRRITESHIERWMHLTALLYGLGTSTAGVAKGLFNPIGWDCWLSAVPLGCQESWLNKGVTTCIRGDNANLYQWIFFYFPLWIIIFLVTVAMYMVYSAYKNQARTAKKWGETKTAKAAKNAMKARKEASQQGDMTGTAKRSFRASLAEGIRRRMSRRRRSSTVNARRQLVTTQAVLYAGAFYVVWFFPTILRIHEVTSDVVYYHWVILSAVFVPIQGLLNVYVYLRPKYIKKRRARSASVAKTRKDTTDGRFTSVNNGRAFFSSNWNSKSTNSNSKAADSVGSMNNSFESIQHSIASVKESLSSMCSDLDDSETFEAEIPQGNSYDDEKVLLPKIDEEEDDEVLQDKFPMKIPGSSSPAKLQVQESITNAFAECKMEIHPAKVVPDPLPGFDSDEAQSFGDMVNITVDEEEMSLETRLRDKPDADIGDLLDSLATEDSSDDSIQITGQGATGGEHKRGEPFADSSDSIPAMTSEVARPNPSKARAALVKMNSTSNIVTESELGSSRSLSWSIDLAKSRQLTFTVPNNPVDENKEETDRSTRADSAKPSVPKRALSPLLFKSAIYANLKGENTSGKCVGSNTPCKVTGNKNPVVGIRNLTPGPRILKANQNFKQWAKDVKNVLLEGEGGAGAPNESFSYNDSFAQMIFPSGDNNFTNNTNDSFIGTRIEI